MNCIYVIFGQAEEIWWPVCWYREEEKALEYCEKANERAEELWIKYYGKVPMFSNEFDPDMYSEAEMVRYFVEEVRGGKV